MTWFDRTGKFLGTVGDASSATARENEPVLTVDQRWIAFESLEGGVNEIHIAPFPRGARPVSVGRGAAPRWRADGRELYYVAPTGDVTAVTFNGTDAREPSAPKRLFQMCAGTLEAGPQPVAPLSATT